MGTYGPGVVAAIIFIGLIFFGISALDLIFYQRNSPSVGWRVQEIDDYAGRGRKRIVFTKELSNGTAS